MNDAIVSPSGAVFANSNLRSFDIEIVRNWCVFFSTTHTNTNTLAIRQPLDSFKCICKKKAKELDCDRSDLVKVKAVVFGFIVTMEVRKLYRL